MATEQEEWIGGELATTRDGRGPAPRVFERAVDVDRERNRIPGDGLPADPEHLRQARAHGYFKWSWAVAVGGGIAIGSYHMIDITVLWLMHAVMGLVGLAGIVVGAWALAGLGLLADALMRRPRQRLVPIATGLALLVAPGWYLTLLMDNVWFYFFPAA